MPHRWLLVSPRHSGSVLHADPLASSAWNCVLEGRKLWAIFPPGTPEAVVTEPDTLKAYAAANDTKSPMQRWFATVLPKLRKQAIPGAKEFTLGAGECIFIPHGWWHAVYNLDPSVALTQNFATWSSVEHVWDSSLEGRLDMLASGWLLDLARRDMCVVTAKRNKDTMRAFFGAVMQMQEGLQEEGPPTGAGWLTAARSMPWLPQLVNDQTYTMLFTKFAFGETTKKLWVGLESYLAELLAARPISCTDGGYTGNRAVVQVDSLEKIIRDVLDDFLRSLNTSYDDTDEQGLDEF